MEALVEMMRKIEKWSNVYQFSFQFWGPDNNNVFIMKDNVDVASFGGEETIDKILERTLQWIREQNPKGYRPKHKINRCGNCGAPIAEGNDFCGECMCEDDGW